MKLTSLAQFAVLALTPVLFTGCGVLYSQQNYGSTNFQQIAGQGTSKTEVIANLGLPNSVYVNPAGDRETFLYKSAKGKNILGLYSNIKRTDMVVVFNETDQVVYSGEVNIGNGWTILSGPFTDSTHPVRTETLLFEPENYGQNIIED
ncbi:MAG: hypothetical protein SFY68_01075 [Candidatus Sumerlaeia bacterium]|nr:hypothetical protein [Candidatus Sumerlaeia bacterium]